MASPFTPLLDPGKEQYDNPSFMNTPAQIDIAQRSTAPKANAVIPQELSSMEDKLKEEGSSTSTLGHVMAWIGAAKGDFRGLQSIEESKRRTALAKSIVPEINKVNTLTNAGKWEEAADYVNKLVGSYGSRADYLVPYFAQMQANISRKQEGWNQLQTLVVNAEESGAADPNHPNHSYYKTLSRLSKDRTPTSETTLLNIATRAQPHIQNIDGTVYITNPSTGKTTKDVQTQTYKDKDFDNYTGIKTAAVTGVTIQGLADLFNDKPVKREDGTTVAPNSREAQLAKAHYINQQPMQARLKLMERLNIEPALAAQLIAQGVSIEDITTGNYGQGGNKMQGALEGQADRITRQRVAETQGIMASDPRALPQGKLPFDLDTFSEVKDPVTPDDIKNSRGRLILLRPEVINNQIKPAIAEIESISDIPRMLAAENITPQTTGEKLSLGLRQYVSSWLGYPIGNDVEVRQAIKTRLRRAIEFVENTAETSGAITGKDSSDIKDLKAYAAGDFKSNAEINKAVATVTQRLQQVLRRAVGGMEDEALPTPSSGKATPKTPAQVLAPVIEKAKRPPQQRRQVTRDPYGPGGIQIPPELEQRMKEAVEATGKAARETGRATTGQMRVEVPDKPNQPTLAPSTQPVYNEDDEIAKSRQQKRMQRVR